MVYFRIHERDIIFALSNITNDCLRVIEDEAVKVGKSNLLMDAIFFIHERARGDDGGGGGARAGL